MAEAREIDPSYDDLVGLIGSDVDVLAPDGSSHVRLTVDEVTDPVTRDGYRVFAVRLSGSPQAGLPQATYRIAADDAVFWLFLTPLSAGNRVRYEAQFSQEAS